MHFLVPCGTTGESPTLSREETRRVVELVVDEAAGRVPVLAGAGGYDTREVIEAVHEMADAGANGILSVTPYYNKPTQEGLFQHYRAIAASTPLPIVVYNVPGRTGCNVEPATLARLAAIPQHRRRQGSVGQHGPDLRGLPRVPDRLPRAVRRRRADAAGDGGRRRGRHLGRRRNEVPAEMARMVEAVERGDLAAARDAAHAAAAAAARSTSSSRIPIPVKAAMAPMGLLESTYRLPMVSPRAESTREDRSRAARSRAHAEPAGGAQPIAGAHR